MNQHDKSVVDAVDSAFQPDAADTSHEVGGLDGGRATAQVEQDPLVASPIGEISGNVLLKATFKLEGASAFRLEGLTALEVAALMERLGVSQKIFRRARFQLARAAKVRPDAMPIACALDDRTVILAVLAPSDMDPQVVVDVLLPAAREVEDEWFRDTERARVEAAPAASVSFGNAQSLAGRPDEPEAQGCPPPVDPPPTPAASSTPAGKQFRDALLAKRLTGNITVTYSAGSEAPRYPSVTVPPAQPRPPASVTLSEPREIACEIFRRTAADRCSLKEVDSTRLKEATFSTSGEMSTLVNMLAGLPAVRLSVQDFQSDQPDSPPPFQFHLVGLVGLGDDWDQNPDPVEHLQACLDRIDDMLKNLKAAKQKSRKQSK